MELTLCNKCLNDFMLNDNTTIRRANLMQFEKEPCCFCQVRLGYDYIIEDKNLSNVQSKKSHIGNKKECVIA